MKKLSYNKYFNKCMIVLRDTIQEYLNYSSEYLQLQITEEDIYIL